MNIIYLLIEFLDELVYGITEAAWPFIQNDLSLNYTQIGTLMAVPGLFATIVEPFIGILGDVWKRRVLILGGGICFSVALFLTSQSEGFALLLISFTLFYPSSGAFVSLSQASLMDLEPKRHDQNMARWTFAGSVGDVVGPPLLIALSGIGFGWRGVFLALGFLAVFTLFVAWRKLPVDAPSIIKESIWNKMVSGFRSALAAMRRKEVIRWLVLLEFSDLLLDVLLGFLALYFHDVVGLTEAEAAGAVFIKLVAGLVGDFLIIPLLEKVDGLRTLRLSVIVELVLFPAFLLVPQVWIKLILAGLIGFFSAGWYAVLQGRLYSVMPGQSGTVMAIGTFTGLFGSLLPFSIGLAADAVGLKDAIWLLYLGPIVLLIGLPFQIRNRGS